MHDAWVWVGLHLRGEAMSSSAPPEGETEIPEQVWVVGEIHKNGQITMTAFHFERRARAYARESGYACIMLGLFQRIGDGRSQT